MSLFVDIEKKLGDFHLSTCFEAGNEVMGILGASGCGKSLTLKCIAGIEKPDRGRIKLDGVPLFDSDLGVDVPPQKRRVGLLFQNYALFPNMTVEGNIMAGLKAAGKARREAKALAARIMERFYLTGLESRRPCQLSGGQQQRVALARILVTNPKLLMLDEPFSALDGYLRWKVELELMDVLSEFGLTTLFVSHSRDEIYRLCSRACVMTEGVSTAVVPVKTMFREPQTLAACQLSGCKNYSSAEPVGGDGGPGTRVFARDWGTVFACGRQAPKGLRCIGVRSHAFRFLSWDEPSPDTNVMECRVERLVEDVFHMVVMVLPAGAPADSPDARIRLEMPKETWFAYADKNPCGEGDRIRVGVEPEDILLLT